MRECGPLDAGEPECAALKAALMKALIPIIESLHQNSLTTRVALFKFGSLFGEVGEFPSVAASGEFASRP